MDLEVMSDEEEKAAMRRGLEKAGALSEEAVAAQLHRLRFARVRATYPSGRPGAFVDAAVSGFVGSGALRLGPYSLRALVSRSGACGSSRGCGRSSLAVVAFGAVVAAV